MVDYWKFSCVGDEYYVFIFFVVVVEGELCCDVSVGMYEEVEVVLVEVLFLCVGRFEVDYCLYCVGFGFGESCEEGVDVWIGYVVEYGCVVVVGL